MLGKKVFAAHKVADAAGDLDFFCNGFRHAVVVYGKRDDRAAEFFCKRQNRPRPAAAGLKVDRVDEGRSRAGLERRLDDRRLRGVHGKRHGHALGKERHEPNHGVAFVVALAHSDANVKKPAPLFNLRTGDLVQLVEVF